MLHGQEELNELCHYLTATFDRLIHHYTGGYIYVTERKYNKVDDVLTNLQGELDNDPTLQSKIYILIILDKDNPYIEKKGN